MRSVAFPATAGQWTVAGDHLRCRLAGQTLDVHAPAELLAQVSEVCDGTRAWIQALERLGASWERNAVERFLAGLVSNGALVEASNQLPSAARLGWLPLGLRPAITARALGEHHRALQRPSMDVPPEPAHPASPSALGELLRRRRTPATFGSGTVSGQALVDILWATYGVTATDGEVVRHTIPSAGGLYAIDWYVALLRGNDWHPRGLYKATHHASATGTGLVSLSRLPGDASDAWATLLVPAILSHASAVLYPVARLDDIAIKYSNRALTFALLETGHACQAGALAAVDVGAAFACRGDTVETEVLRMLGLADGVYPLPACAVGSAPTEADATLAADAGAVTATTVPGGQQTIALATRLAIAGPIRIGSNPPCEVVASGRADNTEVAVIKAEAEAWERIGWSTPVGLVTGPQVSLQDAIDPRRLCRYSEAQYRRAGFPLARWSTKRAAHWKRGQDRISGREVWLPVQAVYSLGSLPAGGAMKPYTNATTSGMAAWTTPEGALAGAVAELVERDALMRAWLAQLPVSRIPLELLAASLGRRIRALREAGYDVQVCRLASRWLPVVLIAARRAERSCTVVTSGAGFSLDEAADRALLEVESKLQGAHGKAPAADFDSTGVRSHQDHGRWFRTRAGHGDADSLLAPGLELETRELHALERHWATDGVCLLATVQSEAHALYAVDLTPPHASTAQGRTPLHVWRAFVPSLLPLWFGHGMEPWGSIADLSIDVDPSVRATRTVHPCT